MCIFTGLLEPCAVTNTSDNDAEEKNEGNKNSKEVPYVDVRNSRESGFEANRVDPSGYHRLPTMMRLRFLGVVLK